MTYTPHPTVVTGETWTAADQNTYVKDNLDELFPYTAAQQVAYSTSTDTLNVATASAKLQVLKSNSGNTAIEFGSVIGRSQVANVSSTTNSTPTNSVIQCGTYTQGSSSTTTGVTVTFPTGFTESPFIWMFCQEGPFAPTISSISTTQFVFFPVSTSTFSYNWMAVGAV